jgi:hypothetical protein
VTDEAALAKLPPIDGIIHAAGVLDDGLLVTQTAERMQAVLAPKVAGGASAASVDAGAGAGLFVLCSSAVSLFGNPDRRHTRQATRIWMGWPRCGGRMERRR